MDPSVYVYTCPDYRLASVFCVFCRVFHCQRKLQQQHVLLVLPGTGTGTVEEHRRVYFDLCMCAVLLCLVVCLTLLASFFLPSHFSLKHVYIDDGIIFVFPPPSKTLHRVKTRVLLCCYGCREVLGVPLSLACLWRTGLSMSPKMEVVSQPSFHTQ